MSSLYGMQRVHILVKGAVQGVFFRSNTKREAESLDLTGYARNIGDGTVEIIAEGPKEKLDELVEYCKKGPEAAVVEKIDVKFDKATNEFEGFEIKH